VVGIESLQSLSNGPEPQLSGRALRDCHHFRHSPCPGRFLKNLAGRFSCAVQGGSSRPEGSHPQHSLAVLKNAVDQVLLATGVGTQSAPQSAERASAPSDRKLGPVELQPQPHRFSLTIFQQALLCDPPKYSPGSSATFRHTAGICDWHGPSFKKPQASGGRTKALLRDPRVNRIHAGKKLYRQYLCLEKTHTSLRTFLSGS